MTQINFVVDATESKMLASDAAELIFLDDASYEFVGGGDAVNGY